MVAVDSYFNDVALLLHGDGTNGTDTVVDSSNYNRIYTTNNGIVHSNTQSFQGSSSLYISTNGQHLEYNNMTLFNRDFTIECAIYITAITSTYQIICTTYNVNYGQAYSFGLIIDSSGHLIFSDLTVGSVTSPTVLSTGTWYQVACTYNSLTNEGKIYINSALDSTGTLNITNTSSTHLFIAANPTDTNTNTWYFRGYIDEFRITYDRIRATVTSTQTAPFPNGVSYVPILLTESLTANNFITNIHKLNDASKVKSTILTSGTTNVFLSIYDPVSITVLPEQGDVWKPSHSYTTNDLVFPTTVETTNYYYKLTNSGTSSATEPTWGTTIGGTTTDSAGRTYECIDKITQPITQSPIVPYIV